MAKYLNPQAVRSRLESKVKFAEDNCDPNAMGPALFNSLVNEAESQLEIDLMMRYEVPLQAVSDGTFKSLPQGTGTFITTLAELLAVVRILETDFGRGTSANGDKYTAALQKRYDGMVKMLVQIKEDTYQTWLRPPLAGLKLAYSNQADSGFRGRVYSTSESGRSPHYAIEQINAPGDSLWDGRVWGTDER